MICIFHKAQIKTHYALKVFGRCSLGYWRLGYFRLSVKMRKVLHLVILTWNFAEKNFFSFIFQRFCQTSRAHIQNTFESELLSSRHVPAHVPLHTNISTTCEICSKLTIKTSERCHWRRRAGVFIANTEQISLIVLKFWLLNLIKKFSDVIKPKRIM